MPKKSNSRKKVYCSLAEIEKEFFPKSFNEKIQENKREERGIFGSELATDLLKKIQKELQK